MVEFSGGEESYPFCLVVGTENVKIHLKFLICSFSLTICLRVIGCGQANIVFKETSEFLDEGRGKLRAMVQNNSLQRLNLV